MRKDIGFVEEMADLGALMQVNADSIIGKDGFGTKRYCKKLMKQDLLSFVGSDCHGTKERISRIGEAYDYVSRRRFLCKPAFHKKSTKNNCGCTA